MCSASNTSPAKAAIHARRSILHSGRKAGVHRLPLSPPSAEARLSSLSRGAAAKAVYTVVSNWLFLHLQVQPVFFIRVRPCKVFVKIDSQTRCRRHGDIAVFNRDAAFDQIVVERVSIVSAIRMLGIEAASWMFAAHSTGPA